ncbi:MAG: hypothetical protein IJV73_05425 [Clostridia bacterium]|nr:hypothetical protein [Clostridia bacterium]
MTVKEVSEAYYIQKIIDRYDEKIAQLYASLEPGGMNFSGMPSDHSPKNRIEEVIAKVDEIKRKKRIEEAKQNAAKAKLEKFIDECGNPQIRIILMYRFVDFLKWDAVAAKLGGGNTAESVKMTCYRFLKKIPN